MGDNAVSFINSSKSVPWFLYLATPNPHPPFVAEPKYENASVPPWDGDPAVFETDKSDKPPWIQRHHATIRNGRIIRREQLQTLMSVDDMVDRVMQTVNDTGQLDNTLVIFISDNGYLWAEHGWTDKRVPYTQSIEVPMFASWPGRIPAGVRDSRMVANIDIAPTVLEAAGITASHTIDGHSLLSPYARTRILTEYWNEGMAVPTWASIRTKTGQYVEYYDHGAVVFTEFYDLVLDPWQLDNLSVPPPGWPEQLAADRGCAGVTCP